MIYKKILFNFLILTLLSISSFGARIVLDKKCSEQFIGLQADIFFDKTSSLTIEDILENKSLFTFLKNKNNKSLNFGYTSDAIWVKFEVDIDSSCFEDWLLVSGNNSLNYLDFYIVDENEKVIKSLKTGNQRPFKEREENHRHYIFYFPQNYYKPFTVYIRFKSEDAMALILNLHSTKTLANSNYHIQLLEGLYYGTMLIMALYNFLLFIAIRDKSYLYYFLYITAFGLVQFAIDGLAYQYIFYNFSFISSRFAISVLGLMLFFIIAFIKSFLGKENINSKFAILFSSLQVISLLHFISCYFLPLNTCLTIGWFIALAVVIPIILFTLIYYFLKGFKAVRYLLIGWISIIIGAFLYGFANFGILPFNFLTTFGLQIGTVLDVLFLSFALADRINILRQEKQTAQKQTIEQLEENRKLLEKLNQEQKNTMQAFVDGEENERKRLASELHDGIGQLLSVVRLNLYSLDNIKNRPKDDDKALVVNLTNLVDEACKEVRNVSHNLMPTTVIQLGLSSAIEEFCKKINITKTINIHFQNINFKERLPTLHETTLYRAVQEIVNNAIKHSKAKDVYIQLVREDDGVLHILIEDNGIGFDINSPDFTPGLGLNNIISRIEFINGKIFIDSSQEKGTNFQIFISTTLNLN